jgi:hypothetical protein
MVRKLISTNVNIAENSVERISIAQKFAVLFVVELQVIDM